MKRLGAIISKIEPNSIAQELELMPGDEILSVNSVVINDIMEYSFQTQDEEIELEIKHQNGEIEIIEIEKEYGEDLGISFETLSTIYGISKQPFLSHKNPKNKTL